MVCKSVRERSLACQVRACFAASMCVFLEISFVHTVSFPVLPPSLLLSSNEDDGLAVTRVIVDVVVKVVVEVVRARACVVVFVQLFDIECGMLQVL